MNEELQHKLDKIIKMLFMLLNEEQKEIIKQYDLEYFKQKLIILK